MKVSMAIKAFYRGVGSIFLAGVITMVTGCIENKVGDMTAQQAFGKQDMLTAEWVAAVDHADYKLADRLLAQGANPNLVGEEGISPLLWMMGARWADIKRLEYMLKAGANPNYIDSRRQYSAMYFGSGGDSPDVLRLLLKYGGNPNLPASDITGEIRVLAVATNQGRFENVKMLVNAGADVNWLDKDGYPPAPMFALTPGRFDILAYLIEHGLTADLEGILWSVEHRLLPADSDQNEWKEKVINMLKERINKK